MEQMTCLIQLATDDGREYVIDVLADGVWDMIGDLAPLFSDRTIVKIGHGVDGVDIQSLHRDFGLFVVNIFDTIEAAKALRLKEMGLARLCEYYNLPNCETYAVLKEKYQNSDWTKRPLTDHMVLYGRYDVHYLVKLRRLMMRDLVKHDHNVQTEFGCGNAEMAAYIKACNKEDGIEDDCGPLDVDDIPHDDIEAGTTDIDDTDRSCFHAKELRMNSSLMQVISSCQDKCLRIWKDKREDCLKDSGYITLLTNAKKEGNEWSSSQLELYEQLAHWRDSVAAKEEVLSGFVCGLEFLAKVSWIRPRNRRHLQQICYHLPPIFEKNDCMYLEEVFALVEQSCLNDSVRNKKVFPSYLEWKKRQQMLGATWITNDGNWWLGLAGTVAAVAATTTFIKLRNRK
jgi:ribonuclease D